MKVISYINDWDEQVTVCLACYEANRKQEISRIINEGIVDTRSLFVFDKIIDTEDKSYCVICNEV